MTTEKKEPAIDRLRRRYEFSAGGADVWLQFRTSDIATIRAQIGPDYVQKVALGLDQCDPTVVDILITNGAKKFNKDDSIDNDFGLTFDEIPISTPVSDLIAPLMNAFYLAVFGKTFAEQQSDAMKLLEDAQESQRKKAPRRTKTS